MVLGYPDIPKRMNKCCCRFCQQLITHRTAIFIGKDKYIWDIETCYPICRDRKLTLNEIQDRSMRFIQLAAFKNILVGKDPLK